MQALYKTLADLDFDKLPPLLQQFHSGVDSSWEGKTNVVWSKIPFLRAILYLCRLPKETNDITLSVNVHSTALGEHWVRQFGNSVLSSRQFHKSNYLYEQFGPMSLQLKNSIEKNKLLQVNMRNLILGLPIPKYLSLNVEAYEWENNNTFHFSVNVKLHSHLLISYTGWLKPLIKN